MRLFISAGEASGDAYGAALVDALREEVGPACAELTIQAVGGPKLRAAGVEIVADSSTWGAIGVVKSLGVGWKVLAGWLIARRALSRGSPGLLVTIDFGAMNIRLAAVAKRLGWKVLYFIPPGSWRRDRQGIDLPRITDAIVTPFSWSADILNGMGANAHWFGHPIKSMARDAQPLSSQERTGVAILPGSRLHEIEQNLPAIAKAIEGLPSVVFAVAPTLNLEQLRQRWLALGGRPDDVFTPGDVFGVLGRARATIVCSGTATLQAAVAKCPMVVIYRLSKLMKAEGWVLGMQKKLKFISLPNIFLDRPAVPELIGDHASPGAMREKLDELIAESPARAAQLAAFEEIDAMLGPDDCIERTADLMREMLGSERIEERGSMDYLRKEQEEEARRVQRQSGTTDVGKVLVKLGMGGEREVAQAKAQELGYNFVDLERFMIEQDAVQSISGETCKRLTVMPVKRDGMNLYVAMVDGIHIETLDEIRLQTGCRIIPVIAVRDSLLSAVAKYYS